MDTAYISALYFCVVGFVPTICLPAVYYSSDKTQYPTLLQLHQTGSSLHPERMTLRKLETRFAHEIPEIFGIAVNALTANEAQYLVGFRSIDEIRNRVTKARQEIHLRLRSKGIFDNHSAET